MWEKPCLEMPFRISGMEQINVTVNMDELTRLVNVLDQKANELNERIKAGGASRGIKDSFLETCDLYYKLNTLRNNEVQRLGQLSEQVS